MGTFDLHTIKYGRIKQAVNLSCAHAKAHLPFDQMKIVEAPKVCYGHFYKSYMQSSPMKFHFGTYMVYFSNQS